MNLINSVEKIKGSFKEEKNIYLYIKAICEKVLKIKSDNAIKELSILINSEKNDIFNTDAVKFYYRKLRALYTDFKDYKKRLKEGVLEDKDE